MTKLVENAAGRMVPVQINGNEAVAFRGVGRHYPQGYKAAPPLRSCSDYPVDGDKVVADLKTALERAELRDGMTISTHHHLRNGDFVANAVFAAAAELGVKDLRWFPSASFPCHEPQIAHLESGLLHHIEGSMNGPLGDVINHFLGQGMLENILKIDFCLLFISLGLYKIKPFKGFKTNIDILFCLADFINDLIIK